MTTCPELLAAQLGDNSFTTSESRLAPGVYPSDPQGHTLLVGTNNRAMTVLDLGGVVQVAGLDITDPHHLDVLADRLHELADRMRARQTGG
ncbi:hypothetical protein [Micromonospora sp. 4G55]|uniref:hypothetical protein n=1 Tax=Micromonospora sp. 4G55 TaxID=2806102 RepID=UPI001A449094|nr:hypothetical protein [Micromonospora sp. 4G55]MBM0257361.1 hypothetical protein [Micromonospora sp. 4G55]